MAEIYLKMFEKSKNSTNEWILELLSEENGALNQHHEKYNAPEFLFWLNEREPFMNAQGKVFHWNRRIRDGAPLHVLAQ